MKRNCRVLLCIVLLLTIYSKACARNEFGTDLLARMAETMGITAQLAELPDGIHYRYTNYRGKPVTVIVGNQAVQHIGYSLFTPYQRSVAKVPACNFLERFSLEIELPLSRPKSVERHIAESGVSFEKGTFASFPALFADTAYLLSIKNENNKSYMVKWSKNNQVYCSVMFPIDYDLLNGTEMLENERRIGPAIRKTSAAVVEDNLFSPTTLSPTWQQQYFVQQGESYYTDQLNTNKYYKQIADGEYQLVYDAKYPLESLTNLLTSAAIDNQFVVDIRLKKYGLQEETISVPLNAWVNFCLNSGCTPFVGVVDYDGNYAICQLLMRNADWGYNHVMKVTLDITQLPQRKGIIVARLNSYVPTSRIKYLFDELKQ